MNSPEQLRIRLNNRSPRLMDLDGKRHAAVAMVIRFITGQPEVLLIERAKNESDPWSGHLAMPGGRIEPNDKSPRQAAVRETMEEIGLELNESDYLGQLSDVDADGIPMVISCFVYSYSSSVTFQLESREVADAFWHPLAHLKDPSRAISIERKVPDGHREFPAIKIPAKSQPLWGITYKLLQEL